MRNDCQRCTHFKVCSIIESVRLFLLDKIESVFDKENAQTGAAVLAENMANRIAEACRYYEEKTENVE
jgi:hypothetical protein